MIITNPVIKNDTYDQTIVTMKDFGTMKMTNFNKKNIFSFYEKRTRLDDSLNIKFN